MKTIPLKPERQAELEEFARRRGKTPAEALDEALAAYWNGKARTLRKPFEVSSRGMMNVEAGHTRPAAEFLANIRRKHDISR